MDPKNDGASLPETAQEKSESSTSAPRTFPETLTHEQLIAIQCPRLDMAAPPHGRHYKSNRLQKQDGSLTGYIFLHCLTVDVVPGAGPEWHCTVSLSHSGVMVSTSLWTKRQRATATGVINRALKREDGGYVGKGPEHQKILNTAKTYGVFVPLTEEEKEYLSAFLPATESV